MLPPSPDTSHFDSRTVQCQNSYKICQRPRKEMHQAQKLLTASRHQQNLTSFSFCLNECLASLQNSCKELKHTLHCKCLQGFTGTLRGKLSAGISNLRGLHVHIPTIFEVNQKKCGLFKYTLY